MKISVKSIVYSGDFSWAEQGAEQSGNTSSTLDTYLTIGNFEVFEENAIFLVEFSNLQKKISGMPLQSR